MLDAVDVLGCGQLVGDPGDRRANIDAVYQHIAASRHVGGNRRNLVIRESTPQQRQQWDVTGGGAASG